jgi:transcriptional regulator NrdR family protein
MECPRCNSKETRRITKYLLSIPNEYDSVIRHRYCLQCFKHFDTIEEPVMFIEINVTDKVLQTRYKQSNEIVERTRQRLDGQTYITHEKTYKCYVYNPKEFKSEAKDYV